MLTAFAEANIIMGYRGSMNFIAALLLLFLSEEQAFWCFRSIVEDYLPNYFADSLVGVQVDQLMFESLLEQIMPEIYDHIQSLDKNCLSIFTGKWFLCLFINALPMKVRELPSWSKKKRERERERGDQS